MEWERDCKHMFAVRFTLTRTEQNCDGTQTVTSVTVERQTYKQDWESYNKAQTNEQGHFQAFLADLCNGLSTPPQGNGRPRIPPRDAAFCAILKTYSTLSARRFMGDLEVAHQRGFIGRVPHFNSVLNFFDAEDSENILHGFIERTAAPLVALEDNFAVDSTGFAGASYARWFDEKYGKPKSEVEWIKLHAIVGVRTNVVTACKITAAGGADCPQLPELVNQTARQFTIGEVVADKAYTSRDNFDAVIAAGGQFYPAFRANATGGVGGAYQKAFHLFSLNRDDYMRKYHQRSNVESSFSAIKRLFGSSLRSKSERTMRNELLARVVGYNITCVIQEMYKMGVNPEFVVKPRCTKTEPPAHKP
jgi:transposase